MSLTLWCMSIAPRRMMACGLLLEASPTLELLPNPLETWRPSQLILRSLLRPTLSSRVELLSSQRILASTVVKRAIGLRIVLSRRKRRMVPTLVVLLLLLALGTILPIDPKAVRTKPIGVPMILILGNGFLPLPANLLEPRKLMGKLGTGVELAVVGRPPMGPRPTPALLLAPHPLHFKPTLRLTPLPPGMFRSILPRV